jgi:hypothetical protein
MKHQGSQGLIGLDIIRIRPPPTTMQGAPMVSLRIVLSHYVIRRMRGRTGRTSWTM